VPSPIFAISAPLTKTRELLPTSTKLVLNDYSFFLKKNREESIKRINILNWLTDANAAFLYEIDSHQRWICKCSGYIGWKMYSQGVLDSAS